MFVLAAVVLGLVVVRIWFLQGYTIVSRSMEDTLWLGDSVIVEKSTHLVGNWRGHPVPVTGGFRAQFPKTLYRCRWPTGGDT